MTNEQMRREFEAMIRETCPLWGVLSDGVGGYHNARTDAAWIGYQAATAKANQWLEHSTNGVKSFELPFSKGVSHLLIDGFVILDKDMREWAQAREMHVTYSGSWHVMIGKKTCTVGYETPQAALEACWESGEYDDLPTPPTGTEQL